MKIFTVCYHQVCRPTSLPQVEQSPSIFLSMFCFQTDVQWFLGCTQPLFQKGLMVRQLSGHVSSRMLSCHRPSSVVHVAQVTLPFHRTFPPILLVVRFARVRQLLLLSLCGRLFLPLRSFLSDGVCLCHDSIFQS